MLLHHPSAEATEFIGIFCNNEREVYNLRYGDELTEYKKIPRFLLGKQILKYFDANPDSDYLEVDVDA